MFLKSAEQHQLAITAEINYIKANTQATFDLSTIKKSADKLTEQVDKRMVDIVNARLLTKVPTLNEDGFGLVANEYQVTDYFDDAAVSTELYPQLIKHLTNLTHASQGMVFDHTIRSVEDTLNRSEKRSPIHTVHNDYIASSAKNRLDIELDKQGLKASDYRHYQFVNTWIPLVDVVLDSPLAFVDARTVSATQSHVLQVAYPDRIGEIEGFSYNPENRWFYFPKMTSKEQLNFKVFDSDESNSVKRIPHSAFSLPSANKILERRVSIELRTILLFSE
ncbi:CmcJ/NvfI family oxidoreductase [Cognaticolwellia mytili]|uniref:CmcJ/NvfI family oxidoreductase n=1 Tax=Cognaticolwellia mytili TaxID=1888913 RepID=UPI000A16F357|nr:CmcJ/NvfI family oxidoreductase [Cognaticolwellia mytili]